MTPGFRASSSLMLKTIFMRSDPMSAIFVKMPPAMRSAEAPSDSRAVHVPEPAEVDDDDRPDEDLEQRDELELRDEVGLAGLVDELRDLLHRLVDGEVLELRVHDEPEHEPEQGDADASHEERL